ncbi:MAG TPA: hypothetical protein VG268_04360 [Streptosporangiaceae bacterium]|nr:hypothetical protein [Streptosporangiaceae bacterium]
MSDILVRVQSNGRNAPSAVLGQGTRPYVAFMGRDRTMRDPELVARAGYAAARLEQAWDRWRVLHGLDKSSDPVASYVGYSHTEPMGQPRVVIGVDAAEAEFFADFLESHDCATPGGVPGSTLGAEPGAGLPAADTRSVNGVGHPLVNGNPHPLDSGALYPPVSGPQPVMVSGSSHPAEASAAAAARSAAAAAPPSFRAGPGRVADSRTAGFGSLAPSPRDVPSEPMARLLDDTDPSARPAGMERPVAGPQATPAPATRVFPAPVPTFTPIGETEPAGFNGDPGHADHRGPLDGPTAPQEPADVMAAELAGWASGELPGQASEQLASWASDGAGAHALNRSRSGR